MPSCASSQQGNWSGISTGWLLFAGGRKAGVLDPVAHAFLREVAMSVPSCPAALQRPSAAELQAAGTQRTGSGFGIPDGREALPDLAGSVRELRFALRLAEHSAKPQLP